VAGAEDEPGLLQTGTTLEIEALRNTFTSSRSDTNHCASAHLFVGRDIVIPQDQPGMGALHRAYLAFDLGGVPAEAILQQAELVLHLEPGQSTGTSGTDVLAIGAYEPDRAWDCGVRWAAQPTLLNPSAAPKTDVELSTRVPQVWNVTPYVQRWLEGTAPNRGLVLMAADERKAELRGFHGRTAAAALRPKLRIRYTLPPSLTIPRRPSAAVDGRCDAGTSSSEYSDFRAFGSHTAYYQHDGRNLHLCLDLRTGTNRERYSGVYLDPDNARRSFPQPEQIGLRLRSRDGARTGLRGGAEGGWALDSVPDWGSTTNLQADREGHEYRLPLADFGLACGEAFGLAFYYHEVNTTGAPRHLGWPPGDEAGFLNPRSWAVARLDCSTPTPTPTSTRTRTATPTRTRTRTATASATATRTATATPTATTTATSSRTPTATVPATATPTATPTPTATRIPTSTSTITATAPPTPTVRVCGCLASAGDCTLPSTGAICVTTAPDGRFELADIRRGPLLLTHPSYLRAAGEIPADTADPLDLPDQTLLAGDVNQDDVIGDVDLVEVAGSWGQAPGDPRWIEARDVTGDGRINILDVVAIEFNWQQRGSRPITGVSKTLTDVTQPAAVATPPIVTQEE